MARERRRWLAAATLLAAAVQWGCASTAPHARDSSSTAADTAPVLTPPRADRGNPPFYDVFGKRYFVMATSAGYHERGVASWYGRDFHGLSTSSGETYNMHAMTAAHKTLPIPTWVEVTNLANGKRVIVKVNDRGPFVDDRLIDLSYAAALDLDMVRNGTTRVEVRALGVPASPAPTVLTAGTVSPPPSTDRTAAVAATPSAAPPGIATASLGGLAVPPPLDGFAIAAPRLYVQVGAFAERANALQLVARLKAGGFANPIVVTDSGGRRPLHRVRLGPLRDAQEFDALSGRLRAVGVGDSRLVVDP
jgi:rare lipoprotein A